jgi:hypothetical protein
MSKARLKAKNVLGIAEGGTGATSMGAGAVGVVSQAASVPTGAILQTGGDAANGKWEKYADGTMEFSRRLSITTAISTAAGSLFYSGGIAATPMGVTFVGDLPEIQITLEDPLGISWATIGASASLTNFPIFYVLAPTSVASRTYIANLKAKGRWF